MGVLRLLFKKKKKKSLCKLMLGLVGGAIKKQEGGNKLRFRV